MNHHKNEVLLNHEFVEYSQAKLHVSDLALQRGFGIFDFFKVVQGKPIFLQEHLARFAHSAKEMGLLLPFSEKLLINRIEALMERNDLAFSGVKMILTGGYSPDAFSLGAPNLIIVQQPFSVNQDAQEKGIKLISVDHQRQLPGVKTIDYLMAVKQLPRMKAEGAQDILYYNGQSVTECPRANFFIVTKQGEILTPEKNILSGISRQKIIDLSREETPVIQRNITLEEAYDAKEAFITSTTKNVLPVISLDGNVFGDGRPGPITKELMQKFDTQIEQTIQNS